MCVYGKKSGPDYLPWEVDRRGEDFSLFFPYDESSRRRGGGRGGREQFSFFLCTFLNFSVFSNKDELTAFVIIILNICKISYTIIKIILQLNLS